jgi:hypothetical protein
MQYNTISAYVSGGICGKLWMPQVKGGMPFRADIRSTFNRFSKDGEPATFRDALLSVLMANGGDFQSATFTADTVLRIERVAHTSKGRMLHVFERELSALRDCADLVDAESYVCDFMEFDA